MADSKAALFLGLLHDAEQEKQWEETVVTGEQYDRIIARLSVRSNDPAINAENTRQLVEFKQAIVDPAKRDFKYAHEMSAAEFEADCKADGKLGVCLHEADITLLTNAAGPVTGELSEFVRGEISRANKEGRMVRLQRDSRGRQVPSRFADETSEQQVARLDKLAVRFADGWRALSFMTETTDKLAEMKGGGIEHPERVSYLARRMTSLATSAKKEGWESLPFHLEGTPQHRALEKAGADLKAEGGGE